jgi:hypothetical protein
MDKRTQNRIREHRAHAKKAIFAMFCMGRDNTLFECECGWFGWIATAHADEFAKVEK